MPDRSRWTGTGAAVLLVLAIAGCETGTSPELRLPARMVVLNDELHGTVGMELPTAVAVRVEDDRGRPVRAQLINFVVVSGGGVVFAGSAITDADGEARERWTLGPVAGEQILEARAVDPASGTAIVFARITALADPGPAATVNVVSPPYAFFFRAGDSVSIAQHVRVLDQYQNELSLQGLQIVVEDAQGDPLPSGSGFEVSAQVLRSSAERSGYLRVSHSGLTAPQRPPVFAMFDLESHRWSAAFECRRARPQEFATDSIWSFDLQSTDVEYRTTEEGYLRNEATMVMSGTFAVRSPDGSTVQTGTYQGSVVVAQGPGFLLYGGPSSSAQGVSDGSTPRAYVGGTLCSAGDGFRAAGTGTMVLHGEAL